MNKTIGNVSNNWFFFAWLNGEIELLSIEREDTEVGASLGHRGSSSFEQVKGEML